jgi:hypothetical protein
MRGLSFACRDNRHIDLLCALGSGDGEFSLQIGRDRNGKLLREADEGLISKDFLDIENLILSVAVTGKELPGNDGLIGDLQSVD